MSRPSRTAHLVALASLSLVLAACGTTTDDDTQTPTATAAETATPEESTVTEDPPATRIPSPTPDDSLPSGPVSDAVLQREDVQAAIAAEAQRRGVTQDEVSVVGYAEVTWNDGSIGCPQPGMMYTQALVPGHQLILEVDGARASYHQGREEPYSYCADPIPPLGPGQGGVSDM